MSLGPNLWPLPYFKEDTEGVRTMCKVIEEMRKEVWNEAWDEAWNEAWGKASSEAEQKTRASVRRLYLRGLSVDQIATDIDLPVDEVKNIISSEI
jgi:DNA-directed RNA polymerase specialized sigma24 family protein